MIGVRRLLLADLVIVDHGGLRSSRVVSASLSRKSMKQDACDLFVVIRSISEGAR
jgi:hypothetical protein